MTHCEDAPDSDSGCPDGRTLLDFLRGTAAEELLIEVELHLSRCVECNQALSQLGDGNDSLSPLLRQGQQGLQQLDDKFLRQFEIELESRFKRETVSGSDESTTWEALARPAVKKGVAGDLPQSIGRFRILGKIGSGAFGVVYHAHDPQLDRQVAIKVCGSQRVALDARDAFLDEARKAVRFVDANVVAIYDADWSETAGPFIVMEYMPGGSLKDRLKKGPLPVSETVAIAAQVAVGLQAGHRKRLVHRDLKPGNILFDQDGKAKIADFGLALFETQQHTRRHELAGSPPYMSPEQVRGEAHLLDGRCDIWALGVVLYECLAGFQPFGGPTRADLFEEILERDPKPLRQLREDVPRELNDLINCCLNKNAANRPPTARDIVAALCQRDLGGHSSRRRMIIGAGITIATALAGGAALQFFPRRRPSDSGIAPNTGGDWTNVLRSDPKKIGWMPDPSDSYGYPSPQQGFAIRSTGWSALEFMTVSTTSFQCNMVFAPEDWKQPIGVIWGVPVDLQFRAFGSQTICRGLVATPIASGQVKLSLMELRLTRVNQSETHLNRRLTLRSGLAPITRDAPYTLSMHLQNGSLVESKFQDNVVALESTRKAKSIDPRGGVGLVCSTGYFIVRGLFVRVM